MDALLAINNLIARADDIMSNINERVQSIEARLNGITSRTLSLQKTNQVLNDYWKENKLADSLKIAESKQWNSEMEDILFMFTPNTRVRALNELYEKCKCKPDLGQLDKYRTDGQSSIKVTVFVINH
jgi:hypothetical protein